MLQPGEVTRLNVSAVPFGQSVLVELYCSEEARPSRVTAHMQLVEKIVMPLSDLSTSSADAPMDPYEVYLTFRIGQDDMQVCCRAREVHLLMQRICESNWCKWASS